MEWNFNFQFWVFGNFEGIWVLGVRQGSKPATEFRAFVSQQVNGPLSWHYLVSRLPGIVPTVALLVARCGDDKFLHVKMESCEFKVKFKA